MPKVGVELTAIQAKNITQPGRHAVGGVAGLLLQVTPAGSRSWILRVRVGNKRRDIGIGGYPTVTLSQARAKAREIRDQIEKGIDPILERRAAKAKIVAAQQSAMTFDDATREFMKSKSKEIDRKQSDNWKSVFATYASPIIGNMHVDDIGLNHIIKVLEPIWTERTATAKKLRGRIEAVMAWAIVRGHRHGNNPATWKGNLDAVLPKPSKVAKTTHLRALPYADMPTFMRDLRKQSGMGALALQFAILTAARSGEVRGATWDEIDMRKRSWTIPASRMKKTGKKHIVPLSDGAIALLKSLVKTGEADLVFPGQQGGPISDMTMSKVTKVMNVDAVPHGFRSTFRDWSAECTDAPREVAEMALAHIVRGVEGAYRRGDLYEKRIDLMQQWSRYIA